VRPATDRRRRKRRARAGPERAGRTADAWRGA
jgi:hypothetical protein